MNRQEALLKLESLIGTIVDTSDLFTITEEYFGEDVDLYFEATYEVDESVRYYLYSDGVLDENEEDISKKGFGVYVVPQSDNENYLVKDIDKKN